MALRWAGQRMPALVLGLLAVLTAGAWAQTSIVLPTSAIPTDPAIKRKGELMLLINQAKEELFLNHPDVARQKCLQVLTLDPQNPDARFILAQAERQLRGEAMDKRSPVSVLPDPSKLPEALARSRPTTSVVVLPRDQRNTGILYSAVADGKEAVSAPRPTPFWLTQRYLVGASILLLAVILILPIWMLAERLLSGKRQRVAQAQLFEQMQTALQIPEGESSLDTPPMEDFPIGASLPSAGAGEARTAASPMGRGDAEVNFWGEDELKRRAAASPSGPPEREEEEVIPAEKAFADEDFAFGPASPMPPMSLPGAEKSPRPSEPAAPPATAKAPAASDSRARPSAPAAARAPTPVPEDEGPIELDGISLQETGIKDFDEWERPSRGEELGPAPGSLEEMDYARGPTEAEIQEIPFSLDVPLEQTQAMTEEEEEAEDTATLPVLPTPEEASKPEEVATIRLEDDFPLGGVLPTVAPPSGGKAASEPHSPKPSEPAASLDDLLGEVSPDPHDEILISSGGAPEAEVTMFDDQARPKAVFQDQLARGLAALEKGNWKEAVKYLSVAHALEPTNDFARAKLREAHKKQGSHSG